MIEIWGSILSITCSSAIVWVYLLFCDSFFVRKLIGKRYWTGVFLLLILSLAISLTIQGQIILQMPLEIALECTFCMFLYKCRWDRCFFVTAVVYALGFSIGYWGNQLFLILSHQSYEEYIWNIPLYSASLLARASLLLFLATLTKRFHRPSLANCQPRIWIPLFATFPLLTLVVLLVAYYPSPEQWVWQICLVILDFVDVVALFLLDYMERTSMEREQFIAASERARVQDENIQALSQAYSAQRKMTHDFRTHLATLSDLLEQNNIENVRSYLAELRVRTTERILLVNSHNAAIDAVLNQKGYLGKQQNIDIRFHVSNLSKLHIASADITIVLGNLLDNAIEACTKIKEEDRWIEVQLLYQENDVPPLLFITVSNPSPAVKIQNGKIATTKKDTILHGFGLQNVQDILQRYGAEYTLSYEDGQFSFYCNWTDSTG